MSDVILEEDRDEVVDYVTAEIEIARRERENFNTKVRKWRRQREAKPESETKDWPWEKASNVSVPLTLINTNGIYSKFKNAFGRTRPFWNASSKNDSLKQHMAALTRYLDVLAESRNHLDLRRKNRIILYDSTSLGTQFAKVPWQVDYWSFKRPGPDGSLEQVHQMIHDGPAIVPYRIEDVLSRPFYHDLQRAPWVSTVSHLLWHELKQRENQGIYRGVDELEGQYRHELTEGEFESLQRQGVEPREAKVYDIHEVHLFWDVDHDGIPEDILIWIDPGTGTIIREEFNDLGVRPIVRFPYFDLPYQLFAMGTGWVMEHMQDEVDGLHNSRNDSILASALQMYVTRKGSGIGPKERFRPLKNIQVTGDVRQDFMPVKFPDISQNAIQAEMLTREYGARATGAVDPLMGLKSGTPGSRETSSGTQFLAQQAGQILEAVRENQIDAYGEMGQMIFFQLVRNRDRIDYSVVPPDDVELLKELFSMNVEDIPTQVQFQVRTTEPEKTDEARRQAILTVTQLYNLYGQQMFQLLSVLTNPQMPPAMKEAGAKFIMGGTKLMEKVLEDFGERETDDYTLYIRDIEMMVEAMEDLKDRQLGVGSGIRAGGGGARIGPPGGGGAGGPGQGPGGPMAGAEETGGPPA
jgi:hypothetical protein